jgi:hypothetical protein
MFSLFIINAKSQELLNANRSEIKKAMIKQCGMLMNESADVMLGMFPKPVAEKNDIYNIMFFVAHDKCYKYVVKYGTDKYLNTLVTKFDSPNSGFKRTGKSLKWIDSKGDQLDILDVYRNGAKINAFSLEIQAKQ